MLTLLVIAFYVAAIVMFFVVVFGMMDDHVMPFGCPACYYDGDHDLADQPRPWYRRHHAGGVYCRSCHTRFKEHPNGALVEDRDQ
jgi:hypothetical protein